MKYAMDICRLCHDKELCYKHSDISKELVPTFLSPECSQDVYIESWFDFEDENNVKECKFL